MYCNVETAFIKQRHSDGAEEWRKVYSYYIQDGPEWGKWIPLKT